MRLGERARRLLRGFTMSLVLPEGEDERIRTAAVRLAESGLGVRPIVLSGALPPSIDEDAMAQAFVEARPGTNLGVARRFVRKPLYCAGMMVRMGLADAMVAGVTCPTSRVIEAALMTLGPAPGVKTPSSCFLMDVPDYRTLLFADCAVNVEPDVEMLADIGVASARSMRELTGEEPLVAFLSFSTHGSARHDLALRVREASRLASAHAPEFKFDGELQVDAALSQRVAGIKVQSSSTVAGRANVLIFPDLNSANIGYKLVQVLGGATALGPFLQGFAKPVSDLSRGATVDDIVETALITLSRAVPRSL